MTKQELENYIPKGDLVGFPKEIIKRMLDCQEKQGYQRNVSVFEKYIYAGMDEKGFDWEENKEGLDFWRQVLIQRNFDLFFEKYPKQDKSINIVRVENKENNSTPNFTYAENSCDIVIDSEDAQKFKVGDEVIYFITNKIGTVKEVKKHKFDNYIDIIVDYGNNDVCEYEIGSEIKRPFLLHYREDYNYDVIDFKNLPKRQEPKKWRAENGRLYYFVDFNTKNWFFPNETKDEYVFFDNDNYNSGNYFRTEVEAEIIAQKLNSYFKQLIQEEHEHERSMRENRIIK